MTRSQETGRTGRRRQWINLFEIANRDELTLPYRLLQVQGLPHGEHYDKNVNQLVKNVAFQTRGPVTAVRRGDAHYLAIPADGPLPMSEQRLMPHVARLIPAEEALLELGRLDAATAPIAVAFLQYSLRTPLLRDLDLWGHGRAYYGKEAMTASDRGAEIDIYPGFVWNVVVAGDGHLFVAVDSTSRFVDRRWLDERAGDGIAGYRGRSCLYHYGHQWYIVQLQNLTGASIGERMRQISESAVVGGQSVGYPSPFIEAYRGDEHAVPLLPDERDAGVSPDDGARLSSIPLSPLPPHLQRADGHAL